MKNFVENTANDVFKIKGLIDVYKDLSNIQKFKKNDIHLLHMRKLLAKSDLSKLDSINLNFALANANEGLKNQDEQFKFFKENRAMILKMLRF